MSISKYIVLSSAIMLAMSEAVLAGTLAPLPLAGAGLPGLLVAGAAYGAYRLTRNSAADRSRQRVHICILGATALLFAPFLLHDNASL